MQEEELFGKLFKTIPLYNEGHLEIILQTMDKESAVFMLTQAIKYAYDSGIYSIGETEVISKSLRVLNNKGVSENTNTHTD
jgi:hypothetical protein